MGRMHSRGKENPRFGGAFWWTASGAAQFILAAAAFKRGCGDSLMLFKAFGVASSEELFMPVESMRHRNLMAKQDISELGFKEAHGAIEVTNSDSETYGKGEVGPVAGNKTVEQKS